MSLPSATDATHDDPPATLPLNRRFTGPDPLGRFGSFGGRFVPETLMDALNQLAEAYEQARSDPQFQARLADYHRNQRHLASIREIQDGLPR